MMMVIVVYFVWLVYGSHELQALNFSRIASQGAGDLNVHEADIDFLHHHGILGAGSCPDGHDGNFLMYC